VATEATLTFLRSLWALDHRLRSTSKRMERQLGITAPQRLVLRLLGRSPGLTPSQLADALHLDRGTLSGVLERLVERELVAREPHPSDGRSVRLALTARGRSFDRDTPGTVEHCVQRALAGLSPARVRVVCQVLDAIASELEASGARGGRRTSP
jgi:DNA-binding MarR family transcriptional regulator